jgi:hypothetical protein
VFKIPGAALILVVILLSSYGHAAGVKTSFKQYSVFTYENDTILCEPYQVKQDDWLYKIFRQKGEISEADFPRFLNIFKKINPRINNIDAIAPGLNILIPLRKIDKKDYEQKTPGIVEVPVIEFSSVAEKFELQPYIRKHTIQTGDTVSKLLDKKFLEKGGAISQVAQKTFSHLNPNVTNIDLIYQGTQLVIPDPSILAQPWFKSFLKQGSNGNAIPQTPIQKISVPRLPVISPLQMAQLKRYSELIQGTLINQGEMHFPGRGAQQNLVLDLTHTPLIESEDGGKTIIIPRNNGSSLGKDLVKNIRAYWKQIKIQELDNAIDMAEELERDKTSLDDRPVDIDKFILTLLSITQTQYTPDEIISFPIGTIEMTASFGRISRQGQPDLLINTGSVYGLALEAIKKKGNQLLTISPELTMSELILTLFTHLGYSTWKNPSFTTAGRVEIIKGIYVTKGTEKLLFTRQKPTITTITFLEAENIQFLILNPKKL